MTASAAPPKPRAVDRWQEILAADGAPRPRYHGLLTHLRELPRAVLRTLEEQMAATLREMGVNFDAAHGSEPWGRLPWSCDLLPHVFDGAEWQRVVLGFRQRLRAWEAFLADVYGERAILRAGVVPVQAVLGSPNFQGASLGVPRARGAYFHLSGLCLARDRRGVLQVKGHHFAHATGISYMMQNRRALARVAPELFNEAAVQSVAETSVLIAEQLREAAEGCASEPRVALLAPGGTSAASSEQSFLARRMGVPIVQGGDLVVLDDCVFLKTVRGLERVDVIYNCVPDAWLDPLVFRRDSGLGVPGLVHCLRKGRVALVNGVGSQLADDASLLPFAAQIIRFYLGETPVLPSVPTLWLGDLDQRELALSGLDEWRIRPVTRERAHGPWEEADWTNEEALRAEVRRQPQLYIAQPRETGAATLCFEDGKPCAYPQDHVVFAVRTGADFDVLPGALTRVHTSGAKHGGEWISKDTWVVADEHLEPLLPRFPRRAAAISELHAPPRRQVTSRVADAFYWMGRYLERAHHQAYLISVIETLETEELNSAERRHYQPVWNRLLPPLEKSAGTSRRSIANRLDRYRLLLLPEPGSVLRTYQRALSNAESMPESISPEAWATLNELRTRFTRTRYRAAIPEPSAMRVTRRLSETVTQLIPQFFGVASNTMLADDGWRFCEVGQMLERAVITANSVLSLSGSLANRTPGSAVDPHALEIELSAFLRLLGTRDAYRRIYQMRAEPVAVLELLWQHPEAPRSVRRCLEKCRDLLRQSTTTDSPGGASAPEAVDALIHRIIRVDWFALLPARPREDDAPAAGRAPVALAATPGLEPLLRELHGTTLDLHGVIADSFLNHQAHIAQLSTPLLRGM